MAGLHISSLLQTEPSDSRQSQVRKLLQSVFEQCLRDLPPQSKDEGALAYDGKVLIHVAKYYGECSHKLLDEQRLHATGFNIVEQAYRESNFHDMDILEYARNQRKMLRQMDESIHDHTRTMEAFQVHASATNFGRQQAPDQQTMLLGSSSSSSTFSASTGMSVLSAVTSQSSMSDSSRIFSSSDRDRRSLSPVSPQDDDDEVIDNELRAMDVDMDDIDMESLKHRGKGNYTCPYWRTCQKGGQEGGKAKVFERNCMFRQHLQKHSKPHKCRIPGCPNKDGFARKDQLMRHQQNVKHDQPLPPPMPRR